MDKKTEIIENNRLVKRIWDPQTKRLVSKGKRVGKDFPLTPEERRIYVTKGFVATVKAVRNRTTLSLKESVEFIKRVRE